MITDDFLEITGFNAKAFIQRGYDFLTMSLPAMQTRYMSGQDISKYFKEIDNWVDEYREFCQNFRQYNSQFRNSMYWDLIDKVDSIYSIMLISKKFNKFLRVVGTGDGVSNLRILKENQDLESLGEQTGNRWENIALDNDLIEEDYSSAGGNNLIVPLKFFFNSEDIESIVAVPQGDEIYGRDILSEFKFDSSDIFVLGPKGTLFQTVDILLNLVKGSIPLRRSLGVNKQDFSGSLVGFSYPTIMRQISESFKSDDSFVSLGLGKIEGVGDTVSMEFIVETRLGETIRAQKIL